MIDVDPSIIDPGRIPPTAELMALPVPVVALLASAGEREPEP
jgi:hypothetical protein